MPAGGRLGVGDTERVRISAKVDYAVRAAIELARAGSGPTKGDRIATVQGVPVAFLENILADLRRAGLVGSRRGTEGGYWLAIPAADVSVADIVRAVEGPLADVRGEPPEDLRYPAETDALRDMWIALRANVRAVLEQVTVADLAAGALPPNVQALLSAPDAWSRR
jgi:Rrf2 family protein